MENNLFEICFDRDSETADMRKRIIQALKQGADLHEADKNGVTNLHHAVRFRNPMAVKLLLEQGARVNQACLRNGSTPLHRAVTQTGAPGTAGRKQEAREIVAALLVAGADPSIRNRLGKRPIDYVKDDAIKAMLKNKAAVEPEHPPG